MAHQRSLRQRLEDGAVRFLGAVGGLVPAAPDPPRASNNYGRASRGVPVLVYLIGLVLSPWLTGFALVLLVLGAAALTVFTVIQYRWHLDRWPVLAWVLAVALVPTAVIVGIWWWWVSGSPSGVGLTAVAATIAGLSTLFWVPLVFRIIFGPHHPVSDRPGPAGPVPLWFWIGAVGPDRATVVARVADHPTGPASGRANGDTNDKARGNDNGLRPPAETVTVEYRVGSGPERSVSAAVGPDRVARIELDGLTPSTRHELQVRRFRGDTPVGSVDGSFTTFPPDGAPADVCLAFGSCLSTGSRGRVFDMIGDLDPRPQLFAVIGDLHYENISIADPELFLKAFDRVHASPPLSRLFRSIPLAYMWDDHDYGDNDSDHDSPSKPAAHHAYRRAVPHYLARGGAGTDLDNLEDGAIHQTFTVGRVRVVLTDNRSDRAELPETLLSETAERWLVDQIRDPSHPLVIWVSPTPWIADDPTSDDWGSAARQRRRIAEAIGDRRANLVMVSGDAHMVALDDGTNAAYAGPGTGFPILHAASLDRLGSTKGGTFSGGQFPGAGQFGLVSVEDRGNELRVELAGRRWTGDTLVSHTFTVPVESPAGI